MTATGLTPPPTADGPLAGMRVLVPRPSVGQSPAAVALSAVGARAWSVPLVETIPAEDPTDLDDTLLALGAGWYQWLAVTSAAVVPVLVERAADHVGSPFAQTLAEGNVRVAAVGPGSRRALQAVGVDADLVPVGQASARTLLAAWPAGTGRVLHPRGDLAAPTLADGLRARGWEVDDLVAYRTVSAGPPPQELLDAWEAGEVDAVLLTSASATRALVERFGVPRPPMLVVAIGPSTAAEAERLGVELAGTATEQTMTGLVDALVTAARHRKVPG